MEDNGTRRALGLLVGTDWSVADNDQLAAASRAVARLQSFVDLAKVQISRRTRQLGHAGDTTAHHVLVDEARLSGKDTKAADERDRVCETLPQFEDALADGRCTAGHLDALALHTKDLTDTERADLALVVDDLVDNAQTQPIGVFDASTKAIIDKIRSMHRPDTADEELQRQRAASNVKRWTDRATGMKHTMVALDPIRDATVWTAINHHLQRLRHDPANKHRPYAELQIDALIAATSSGEPGERIPELIVVVDAATVCHGHHKATVCETIDGVAVPPAAVQRMGCEAILTAVIVNPDGTVDQICQQQRSANRKQRRMLAAMYSTCAHPHCEVAFSQCRIHHIEWFSRGGTTVLANLIPLCETHHHLVHEGHWNLTINHQRHLTWHRPDGTTWHTDTGPNRVMARRSTADRQGDTVMTSASRPTRARAAQPTECAERASRNPDRQSVHDRLTQSKPEADDVRHDRSEGTRSPAGRVKSGTSPPQAGEPATRRDPNRRRTGAPRDPDPAGATPPSLF